MRRLVTIDVTRVGYFGYRNLCYVQACAAHSSHNAASVWPEKNVKERRLLGLLNRQSSGPSGRPLSFRTFGATVRYTVRDGAGNPPYKRLGLSGDAAATI